MTEIFNRITSDMNVLTLKTPTATEQTSPLVLVSDNGIATTHQVCLTPEHPVYVLDRGGLALGWTIAANLTSGDLIADIDGGTAVKVVSNTLTQTQETVYNFEVEEAHNYFADELGLWVHNAKLIPPNLFPNLHGSTLVKNGKLFVRIPFFGKGTNLFGLLNYLKREAKSCGVDDIEFDTAGVTLNDNSRRVLDVLRKRLGQ